LDDIEIIFQLGNKFCKVNQYKGQGNTATQRHSKRTDNKTSVLFSFKKYFFTANKFHKTNQYIASTKAQAQKQNQKNITRRRFSRTL